MSIPEGRASAGVCSRADVWEPLLYDYAEGVADKDTCASVEAHLARCPACRASLADIRFMMEAMSESLPAPKQDITARVMERIRAEEEDLGVVLSQPLDAVTGKPIRQKQSAMRRVTRLFGGIAAVFVLAIGLVWLLPLLGEMNSGAATGPQDALHEIWGSTESEFPTESTCGSNTVETDAVLEEPGDGFGVLPGIKDSAETTMELLQPFTVSVLTVLSEDGVDADFIRQVLASVSVLTFEWDEDGFAVTPVSAVDTVKTALEREGLCVTVTETDTEDKTLADAFYVQIREP